MINFFIPFDFMYLSPLSFLNDCKVSMLAQQIFSRFALLAHLPLIMPHFDFLGNGLSI